MYGNMFTSSVLILAANLCMIIAGDPQNNTVTAAAPVSIKVYYESMCPYCRHFITSQLYPTFTSVSASVLDVSLVPFGIAWQRQRNGEWQFACQHGPIECLGNQIATCAMNLTSNDPEKYMPFINCMEINTQYGNEIAALNQCSEPSNISEHDIVTCMQSPEGAELQHQMALTTQNIRLQYTPWIVVNNVHNETIQQRAYTNLQQLVCELYTGPQLDVCQGMTNPPVLG